LLIINVFLLFFLGIQQPVKTHLFRPISHQVVMSTRSNRGSATIHPKWMQPRRLDLKSKLHLALSTEASLCLQPNFCVVTAHLAPQRTKMNHSKERHWDDLALSCELTNQVMPVWWWANRVWLT
jgi:hypothetical protein